ncbi:MAG: rhomboid family intramembrane serine protease [Methanomassiliicoccaceae archaeon]|nr:rhomboid family intramembrane serine protease [Methanomassiliicoccaceae archaeon]
METVSYIVIAIIAVTLAVLATRKYSPTMVLAISNVIVYAVGIIGTAGPNGALLYELSFRSDLSDIASEPWTLITSMFVHADLLHLIFNMVFLLAIGLPLESRIGKGRFAIVYLIGGIAGTMVFSLASLLSPAVRLVGASGAISALMGAMLILYPRERIMFFLGPLLTNQFTVRTMMLVWFAMQLLLLAFDDPEVAYSAHLGGFVAGMGIAWAIRPKSVSGDGRRMRDISPLRPLCTTSSLNEMYDYAANAKDIETREIWTDRMLMDVKCPACGSPIKRKGKGFVCTDGHDI